MKHLQPYKIFESNEIDLSILEKIIDVLQETFDKYEISQIPDDEFRLHSGGAIYSIGLIENFTDSSKDIGIKIYLPASNSNGYYLALDIYNDIKSKENDIESFIDKFILIKKTESPSAVFITIKYSKILNYNNRIK